MLKLIEKVSANKAADYNICGKLELPIDLRIKSRSRANLTDGREAGWVINRGDILRGGDILVAEDGISAVLIIAAPETVSKVESNDSLALTQAAYHLGNRHVPIEINPSYLAYRHDHVLDDMLRGLGLNVSVGQHPFEPEAGAYQQLGAHGHSHSHDHHHDHHHEHSHEH